MRVALAAHGNPLIWRTDSSVLGGPRLLFHECAGGGAAHTASEGANPLNSLLGAYTDDE